MDESKPRFSTGVRFLDMELGGGIPAGDMVALTTPPDSQSELLFTELARMQDLLYVSTICRDEDELEEWIEPSGYDQGTDVTVAHVAPEELLADPDVLLEKIEEGSCLVLDPMNGLEAAGRDRYLTLLNDLKERLRETESIALIHCLKEEGDLERRPLTLKRADHVWHLRQTVESEEIMTTLLVPKSRGNQALTEAISIELADEVKIDTSRNIA